MIRTEMKWNDNWNFLCLKYFMPFKGIKYFKQPLWYITYNGFSYHNFAYNNTTNKILITLNTSVITYNYCKLVLLMNDLTYDRKYKHICNVAFINIVSKVVESKVFLSIVPVSYK
jgi:hypothetical protein